MDHIKQRLYEIADEMRGMATAKHFFADNPYDAERAERIMELAAEIVGLIDADEPAEQIKAQFMQHPWLKFSPALGVEAFVLNDQDELLLIQRNDSGHWALPGGLSEIGHSLSETAVIELWEEAGLKGDVERLLLVSDNRFTNTQAKLHLTHFVYHVRCQDLTPSVGIETLDVGFFSADALKEITLHRGHDQRIPRAWDAYRRGVTYADPASASTLNLSNHQRPSRTGL